jgi:accessory gene regulator B
MAVGIADVLNRYEPKEGLAYKKVVLGAEIVLMNVSKMAIVLLLSVLMGVVPQTLLTLIGFNVLRRSAFGIHALTSIGCTLASLVMFVGIPFFLREVRVTSLTVAIVFVFIFAAMYLYAPADTKARPILGEKTRIRLKKRSITSCAVLGGVLVLIPSGEIKFMVTLGALYSALFVLPATYRILKREVNNYEKYEHS